MKKLKITGMAASLALCGLSMLACEDNVANGTVTDPNTIAETDANVTSSSSITQVMVDSNVIKRVTENVSSSSVDSNTSIATTGSDTREDFAGYGVSTCAASTQSVVVTDSGTYTVVADPTCVTVGVKITSDTEKSAELCYISEFPKLMDSLVIAHSRINASEVCDLPKTPTLTSVNLWSLHRLVPEVELRLSQRGNMDQCHYYLLAWEQEPGTESLTYLVSHVGADSIVVVAVKTNEPPQLEKNVQEFFAIEACGDSLDLNTPVVVHDVGCQWTPASSAETSEDYENWLRADLVEARNKCVADCESNFEASTGEDSSVLVVNVSPEVACASTCDAAYMEAIVVTCAYKNSLSSIECEQAYGCYGE